VSRRSSRIGPVADTGRGEEATHRVVGDRLDELVGNARLAQRPQRGGRGKVLDRQPVAEDLERPNVARDADRRERRAELEQPGPQFGRRQAVDRSRVTDGPFEPVQDHPVPLEGLGRGALGRLGGQEQLDRSAERQVPRRIRWGGAQIRCPKIRGVRCPNHVVASGPTEVWTRSSHKMLCDSRRMLSRNGAARLERQSVNLKHIGRAARVGWSDPTPRVRRLAACARPDGLAANLDQLSIRQDNGTEERVQERRLIERWVPANLG